MQLPDHTFFGVTPLCPSVSQLFLRRTCPWADWINACFRPGDQYKHWISAYFHVSIEVTKVVTIAA